MAAEPRSPAQEPRSTSALLPPLRTSALQSCAARRRLSPGLELRLRRLDDQKQRKEGARRQLSIGRIPEEQLEELERLQRERQVLEIRRHGKRWSGPSVRIAMPQGGVRLSGGPVLTDNEASMLESDVSSIIDISDHFAASETEDDRDGLHDAHKYRMSDPGKTRLHLHTKQPLSPSPRQVPPQPSVSPTRPYMDPTPSTPLSTHSAVSGWQPPKMDFPQAAEGASDGDMVVPTLSRANSVYTLGRASFTGQLSQLTSMRLPDANSLAKRISSIPTSTEAAKALSDASNQIRMWISKASDVLGGLNAEDDVEWAAAGGREGIDDVDDAINRFERLVQVYILSIERLQTRPDIAQLSASDLYDVVKQMESIIASWKKIKDTLGGIKAQVEIAMEWEELWNSVLGEIAQEMQGLNRLVFEMEEKRHQSAEGLLSSKDSIDIGELETIVETHPRRGRTSNLSRMSLNAFSPSSPITPAETDENREDSSLLALFARMQPLRASLDFLPMRLSVFHIRGNPTFPTACLDLENRRDQLEAQWGKLEADAGSLRRELGEDRWVLVFRNAGRQALKMCESITRTYAKLKDGVEAGEQQTNITNLLKKIENYEAKKTHYGPAIERVLAIIDRGVLDRLTVNGEILRLQSDMKRRWTSLQTEMHKLDSIVEEINNSDIRDKELRNSVSTVMSTQPSVASSFVDTPGSSPASSVVSTSRKNSFQGSRTPTPLTTFKIRSSSKAGSRLPSASAIPKRISLTRSAGVHSSPTSSPASISTPTRPETNSASQRARWTGASKPENRDFRPLSAFEPSPYAKAPITPKTNFLRSTSHAVSLSPPATAARSSSRAVSSPNPPSATSKFLPASVQSSRKSSLPVPSTYLTPAKKPSPLNPKASASSLRPASRIATGRRSSVMLAPPDGNEADSESPSYHRRPPSALANGRRSSMLPQRARSRMEDVAHNATLAQDRPKWRP